VNRINLDHLAVGYTHRPPTLATLARATSAAAGRHGVLLDIGGGTGAHAARWVGEGRIPIVVDPSAAMCADASSLRGVVVVCGRSQELPFGDDCASLAYFHLSIHYGQFVEAIDEACRVTRPFGRIEIWTFAPETMSSSALATWFPRIGDLDAARFPPIGDLVDRLREHCDAVEVTCLPEDIERSAGSWEDAVRHGFVSTLQLLTEDEIDEGLAHFRSSHRDPDSMYRYTVEFVRIRAALRPLR